MKYIRLLGFFLLMAFLSAESLQPYVLAFESILPAKEIEVFLLEKMKSSGFNFEGSYRPNSDPNRKVFVYTYPTILTLLEKMKDIRSFAAPIRIAITTAKGRVQLSYVNPEYQGNAFFCADYPMFGSEFARVHELLKTALNKVNPGIFKAFGCKEGMSPRELRSYHYMFGMEYFDDTVELGNFPSFEVGEAYLETQLEKSFTMKQVYKIKLRDRDVALYGIGLGGPKGERKFIDTIDDGDLKHTASMPYELLLAGNKAYMLHARFRLAVFFPDLTIVTFGKIMSTPGDIEELMESICP